MEEVQVCQISARIKAINPTGKATLGKL